MVRITEEDDSALNDLVARLVENLSKEVGGYSALVAARKELPSTSTVMRVMIRMAYRVVRGEEMPTREEFLRRLHDEGFTLGPKQRNLPVYSRDRQIEPAYTEPYLPPEVPPSERYRYQ